MRPETAPAERERQIAALASCQHGLITLEQLRRCGFDASAIARRVRAGRLHRVHVGVYAVGHQALTPASRRLAAVLSCGPGALLSHVSAAAASALRIADGRDVHVSVPRERRCSPRDGVRIHRVRRLPDDDRVVRDGIPMTSVARTLVDLGDVLPARRVRSAFVHAEQLRVLDMRALDAVLVDARGRRGASVMREVLRGYDPRWQQTASELELAMLDVIAAHGLPRPEVNAWIEDRHLADFLWREQRLIVETDGAQTHATPAGMRRDAGRDLDLARRGYRTLRCSSSDVRDRPAVIVRRIRAALADRFRTAAGRRPGSRSGPRPRGRGARAGRPPRRASGPTARWPAGR